MGNIVLLDDLTINKIAAGEVIERPSSVVKEMVENSIDAGAKNITVEIKNGGISLIKITDDGCGIAEDDMEIAFERHATSKIRSANDLETVKSMGFRGEALASIAAIAKVEMVSKRKEDKTAHKIVVEGGDIKEFTEAARSVGTTITVTNLFFNTPVRYKFLKKDYTEAGYIEDAVTRIALVNKDVAIKLINNGKTIIQTNGDGDLKTSVYTIYGKDIATETIEVDYTYDDVKVTGVVGKPVVARGNRANQLFFINGRFVKDKNFSAAADQAFKGMVPVGRFGFVILNLEMEPKMVDVNVHPAKLEVRFEDESKAFKPVYHAIKNALTQSELMPEVKDEPKEDVVEVTKAEVKKEVEEVIDDIEKDKDERVTTIVDEKEEKYEVEEKKPKKGGISGLFHKIIGEQDETDEEKENNPLEEIFKSRQGLNKQETVNNVIEEKEAVEEVAEKVTEAIEEKETVVEPIKEEISEEVKPESTRRLVEIVEKINRPNEEVKEEVKIAEDLKEVKVEEKEEIEDTKVVETEKNEKPRSSTLDIIQQAKKKLEKDMQKIGLSADDLSNTTKYDDITKAFDDIMGNMQPKAEAVEKVEEKDIVKEEVIDEVKETSGIINEDEVDKKASLNNTIITSNTREIDVENVNTLIKEATQKMISTKLDNVQATQIIDSQEVAAEEKVATSFTQIIDTTEVKEASQDTVPTTSEELVNMPQHTTIINSEDVKKEIAEQDELNNATAIMNHDNVDEFYTYAEKMFKEKLEMDNTQMIDTAKVREALKEDKFDKNPEFDQMYKKTFGVETVSVRKEKEEEKKIVAENEEKINASTVFSYANENMNVFEEVPETIPEKQYKLLGTAFNTYIIIEVKNEMYMIDQESAHERIMYEKLLDVFYSDDSKDEQMLLLPDVISLDKKEMAIAKENEEMFNKAGFVFEEFGGNTIKLVTVPGIVEELNTKELFQEIISEIGTVAVNAQEEKEEKFVATIASKIAEASVMDLDDETAQGLLDTLFKLDDPFVGNGGKPLAIKMTKADLEKKFSRRK